LAHRESFGLPISEVQACESCIFTPYTRWAPGHFIKDDPYQVGEGRLSDNFVVYNNDLDKLKTAILEKKANFDPNKVKEIFLQNQPQFFHGNKEELKNFVNKLEDGEITGQSHLAYKDYVNKAESEYSDNNWAAQLPPEDRR